MTCSEIALIKRHQLTENFDRRTLSKNDLFTRPTDFDNLIIIKHCTLCASFFSCVDISKENRQSEIYRIKLSIIWESFILSPSVNKQTVLSAHFSLVRPNTSTICRDSLKSISAAKEWSALTKKSQPKAVFNHSTYTPV